MRHLNLLTMVLFVLQLIGIINVSWWLIVAPTLLYIAILLIVFTIAVVLQAKGYGGK